MKKILIICQAHYSSTRLPGKVLKEVLDRPLLLYVIRRLEIVPRTKLIIAIGDSKSNQPIIELCEKQGVDHFIGSENDVLDRYYQTAKFYKGNILVRITSDCPLIDPDIINQGIEIFLSGDYDYISNGFPPTYPDGFDTEVFSFKALEKAWKEARLPSEREHVTPYIWKNKNIFNQTTFKNVVNLSNFRLTVDTKEDFELLSNIIEHFYDNWLEFRLNDVIQYLTDSPELLNINSQYPRNEGYIKSLKEDKKVYRKI